MQYYCSTKLTPSSLLRRMSAPVPIGCHTFRAFIISFLGPSRMHSTCESGTKYALAQAIGITVIDVLPHTLHFPLVLFAPRSVRITITCIMCNQGMMTPSPRSRRGSVGDAASPSQILFTHEEIVVLKLLFSLFDRKGKVRFSSLPLVASSFGGLPNWYQAPSIFHSPLPPASFFPVFSFPHDCS